MEKEVGVSRRCRPASVPLRKACPTAPSCTGRPWRWGWAHRTGTGAHGARIKSVARRRRSPIQGEGGARLTGSATSCRVCVRRQRAVRPMAVYAHTADGLQWPYTPQIARRAGLLRDNELGGGGWEERWVCFLSLFLCGCLLLLKYEAIYYWKKSTSPPPFILGLIHPPTMKPSVLPPELSKTIYFTPGRFFSGGLLQYSGLLQ